MILRLAHVKLTAQDRLDALGLCRIEKVHRAVDVSVIRHGHGLLSQRRHTVHELIHVASAVEEGVFGMQMQRVNSDIDKLILSAGPPPCFAHEAVEIPPD